MAALNLCVMGDVCITFILVLFVVTHKRTKTRRNSNSHQLKRGKINGGMFIRSSAVRQ